MSFLNLLKPSLALRCLPQLSPALIWTAASVSLLCILLHLLPVSDALSWLRPAIDKGQYWRLISGNLLHTNFWHLWLNLAGLWTILGVHHFHYNARGFTVLLLLLCLGEGLALWWYFPALTAYVGLSGILHGLFGFGAILDIRGGLKSGWLLLLGVILKVSHESLSGGNSEIASLIQARVATESHLIGLIWGVVLALSYLALRKYRQRRNLPAKV